MAGVVSFADSIHSTIRRLVDGASGRTSTAPYENGESAELLFGVRVGAVLHATFVVPDFDGGARFRDFQGIAIDIDRGLDHRLVIRAPSARVWVGAVAFSLFEGLRGFVDQ